MVAGSDATPSGVGETAIGAAMMRARESLRDHPLFDDPYAAAFVAAAPPVFEDGPTTDDDPELARLEAAFEAAVSVRTRFYDEYLLAAAGAGCRQVVLLGAGLDTRAFRLSWPSATQLFELDIAEVLAFKERVLAQVGGEPGCRRTIVATDLRADWQRALLAAGFKSTERTAWVAEGVLPYLSNDDAHHLLVSVSELSSSGTTLALDQPCIPEDSLLARAQAMPVMEDVASMWQGGLDDNAILWLRARGWAVEAIDGAALAAQYARGIGAFSNSDFLTATRL